MKRILSFLFVTVFALSSAFSLSSCANTDDTLYYFNFKPEIAEVFTELAHDYKAETGKTLRVVTAASGTYEQTLKSEISKKDPPVIFQINGPKGYAAWKDYCLDLSDSVIYEQLTDKSLAIRDGDGVYGIPYVVESYGIIYNKALTDAYFALPARQTEFSSIEEIRSFDALKTVVEDMTKHKSALGIDGVFASTSLKSGEDWRWQTHLANIPIYEEFAYNDIDLSSDATGEIDFLYGDAFRNIFDLYINNSTVDKTLLGSKQVADSMAEFALGKCVMVQNGSWAWSQIAEVEGNTVEEENIRYLPIYMDLPGESDQGICIGTENYICVNKTVSEEKQKQALDFLEWLYTSETGKDYVTNRFHFITPFQSFESDEVPADPLARETVKYLNSDLENIPWAFTVFPSTTFKNDFGSALLQYAQGTKTWDQVVQLVKDRWKEESGR